MTTRRTAILLGTLASWPFLTGFFYPPFFDLSWDEEVQLHDGRVILVHLKFTYERLSRFSKYGNAILRNTEMSFDAGPPRGRVTQLFRRQKPVMLDQKEGKWYVVLIALGGLSLIRDEDWGPIQTSQSHRVGKMNSTKFEPVPIDYLPGEFDTPNIDYHYGPLEDRIGFDAKTLTLLDKRLRNENYPLGPGDRRFERPNPSVFQQMKSREKKQ
ncbi:MAG: hypothetical protein IPG93_19500 [Burkholderiales bacterium]|nr:hypothetical protein [Burkholderiales bacterium]